MTTTFKLASPVQHANAASAFANASDRLYNNGHYEKAKLAREQSQTHAHAALAMAATGATGKQED